MEDLKTICEVKQQQLKMIGANLKIDELKNQLTALKSQASSADFWQDNLTAQTVMKQTSLLEAKIDQYVSLEKKLSELAGLIELNDNSLRDEIATSLINCSDELETLIDNLSLNGEYDDHDAIISIYAGAGGTDAQDWTSMLLRMYLRYCEIMDWKTSIIDESSGEEAGLKSVSFSVDGINAYGLLKGEKGVHRLVRLSPFNADNLRQTSFAKVDVLPKISELDKLEIDEADLKIDVYRSGGHGGQSVNTTDSAVRITHLPTGITVAIQNERSQQQNKLMAMTIIRSRLAQLQLEQHQAKLSQLKGPNQSAEWGNQIRNYVLHPYKQVKDLRTGVISNDPEKVLNGELDEFIKAELKISLS